MRITAIAVAVLVVAFAGAARADDLDLMSSVALKTPLVALLPLFEKESGKTIKADYGSAVALKRKIDAGSPFCVAILSAAAVDDLVAHGIAAKAVPLAHIGVGVAYRAGTPKPDIGSLDALKETLTKAKSISVSDPAAGGSSSAYFQTIVDQLGIAPEIARKTILTHPGEGAQPVLAGQADIGIVTMSESAGMAGVETEQLFASDVRTRARFALGVSTRCKSDATAEALVAFLHTPRAASAFKSNRIDPD